MDRTIVTDDNTDDPEETTMNGHTIYYGLCDASAAVAIDENYFLVANDEDNVLRLFDHSKGGKPITEFDLNKFLDPKRRKSGEFREVDIEAATRIGDIIYWIASHGRNKDGKRRPSRYRFFATRIVGSGKTLEVQPLSEPHKDLLKDLLKEPSLKKFNFAAAAKIAPKSKGGLNIEGLAATPEGKLLIGFRNPIPDGKALLVTIDQATQVTGGQKLRPGAPILIDLKGLGIRSLEYHAASKSYLIIAGSYQGGGLSKLFRWSGQAKDDPVQIQSARFKGLNPEALLIYPGDKKRVQILSDDGTRMIKGQDCKTLTDPAEHRFRGSWVELP